MAHRLNAGAADFAARFDGLLARRQAAAADVDAEVAAIVAAVRAGGDAALIDYTRRLDRVALTPATMAVPRADIERAAGAVGRDTMQALETAAGRIRAFHEKQQPADLRYRDEHGVELGWRWTPLAAVGLYVPGGKAVYPSSVLMNAIPARVAGVTRLVMTVPTPDGALSPLVLAAAGLAGVDEIYRVGGAQAVAALAYGTATIARVDKIVGPGNVYVAAAKRQVFGAVGIDTVAGPSEILVVADSANDPEWIAADLLAQAEHDETAQATLITDDSAFADAVAAAVDAALAHLGRADIAAASWGAFGAIIVVDTIDAAAALIDRIAPEHVELAIGEPERLLARLRHAGAIFLGRHTPEAVGDYVAGPSHVLPTGGAARYASGLSVLDFMKRSTLIRCDPAALRAIGPAAIELATAEGLGAHAMSVAIRLRR